MWDVLVWIGLAVLSIPLLFLALIAVMVTWVLLFYLMVLLMTLVISVGVGGYSGTIWIAERLRAWRSHDTDC